MARIIFVTLLVLVAACSVMATILPPRKCCENEVWKECGNACLEPNCDVDPRLIRCAMICQARCECIPGYSRNKYGECIPKKHCKKCRD